ncbi:MAG: sulfite exporter TauE/SafE family protein [Candidatus Binataceae bacterium]
MSLELIILGFGVAALVAVTGVGGGSLMAPVLILGCGVSAPIAVGTDLIYNAVTKAGAVWVYGRDRQVHWRIAMLMLAGSVPAAIATSAGLWLFRHDLTAVTRIVSVSLAAALFLSALAIAFNDRLRSFTSVRADRQPRVAAIASWTRQHRSGLAVAVGVVVGVFVTLSSVGAGALGVAALMLLYPSITPREIVGTDIAYGVLLAATAGAGHFMLHNVDFTLLTSLLIGMVPGVYVGGLFAGSLPEAMLRRLISIALLGVAFKLVVA